MDAKKKDIKYMVLTVPGSGVYAVEISKIN
jgi:hypothetical protein